MADMNKGSPNVNIGISEVDRKSIAQALSVFLADTYTLYLKTHNFHWNVTGPMFKTLHIMFEEQYNEMWQAVDTIAERIRSIGHFSPGTYKQFSTLTSIKEPEGIPHAKEMIKQLMEGHETVIRDGRKVFDIAEKADDQATCDLVNQRTEYHEKTAWMLRSMIEE